MRTSISLAVGLAVLAGTLTAFALEGKNGYTASTVFTVSAAHADAEYVADYTGVEWQDLTELELWNPQPGGGGQPDGMAADGAGNLYFLVQGRDVDGDYPDYTGLVRYDGSSFLTLVQDAMSTQYLQERLGTELKAVVVSPSDTGALTAGDPVVLRWVYAEVAGEREYYADVVSVDASSGEETFLHRFDLIDNTSSRLAIDGSGTSSDGTIYVGPQVDGTIAVLTYSGTAYTCTEVPGTFVADQGLLVDGDGYLYSFSAGATSKWGSLVWPYDDQQIYRIDPGTGSASAWGAVEGKQFIFDWTFDVEGRLWMALRESAKKKTRYVVEAKAAKTTSIRARISESDSTPYGITAGTDGTTDTLYVLEQPFTENGIVHALVPGEDTGGGKPPKKPKK